MVSHIWVLLVSFLNLSTDFSWSVSINCVQASTCISQVCGQLFVSIGASPGYCQCLYFVSIICFSSCIDWNFEADGRFMFLLSDGLRRRHTSVMEWRSGCPFVAIQLFFYGNNLILLVVRFVRVPARFSAESSIWVVTTVSIWSFYFELLLSISWIRGYSIIVAESFFYCYATLFCMY